MRQIETKNVTLHPRLLDHSKFFDIKGYAKQFTNFHKDENGTAVLNWKKVRIIMARKSDPYVLFFKTEYNQEEFQEINLIQKGSKRKKYTDRTAITTKLKPLYSCKQPITTDKYKDLMALCELGVIPEEYHEEYKKLPNREKK